jgi:hypothetical protein
LGHTPIGSTVLRLLRALLPLAMLGVSKPIVNGVVAWITRHSGNLGGIRQRDCKTGYTTTSWMAPGAGGRDSN